MANADAPSSSSSTFRPFIPATESPAELTVRAVILGAVLGIVFAASSVYLALKVGLTVSASIPIAVLSITIFRALSRTFGRKASILENNVVQTAGSAGESIAAGVAFTMPALLLMGYELDSPRVLLVSLLGGLLGVLMMIPLRHGLIVKEHGKLSYPEGTACAQVLVVGEQGGTEAKTVFTGFGFGALYKLLSGGLHMWKEAFERQLKFFKGATFGSELTPELLGVGYIIGPRVSAIMLAGGVLGYLVLMPMIVMFGEGLPTALFPAHERIAGMDADALRKNFVLYIGAGAVATGGLISLGRALPTIVNAFRAGLGNLKSSAKSGDEAKSEQDVPRTSRDLPMKVVLFGSLALVLTMWLVPALNINLFSALLIILFGFFFVTVSSRITGEIGSSSNPISGMTVATLLITCLLFLAVGWTGITYRAMALVTAAIVCVAASNGGTTSQDLKTGYLVGATPRAQQLALLVGVVTSALVIGFTLIFLNRAYTTIVPETHPGERVTTMTNDTMKAPDGNTYRVGFVSEVRTPEPGHPSPIPAGKYLVDAAGEVRFVVDPGIGGRYKTVRPRVDKINAEERKGPDDETYKLGEVTAGHGTAEAAEGSYLVDLQGQIHFRVEADGSFTEVKGRKITKLSAPKAQLFSLIIDGILTRKLPWNLVLIGVMIALVLELCGVASLPFAVGLYLPLATSVPIMVGGAIRWVVDKKQGHKENDAESENSPGTLFSSGYIAGGAIAGLVVAALAGFGLDEMFDLTKKIPSLASLMTGDLFSVVCFLVLAAGLLFVALRKPAEASKSAAP